MGRSISNTKIDKVGKFLSSLSYVCDESSLEMEEIFKEHRKKHLSPLTNFTLEIQRWLQNYDIKYYIAQRLKRRPQILRKLRRLSVRLTQLQDIGGCRIIIDRNSDINSLVLFIKSRIEDSSEIKLIRETDYREFGRDDTGYRAYHLILKISSCFIELQIRSELQHYWSESIERTSVVYGHRLKEKEGDNEIIQYFKDFSNILYLIENKQKIDSLLEIDLQSRRKKAEELIYFDPKNKNLSGHVNLGIIKTLEELEKKQNKGLNNWILIFDWNEANFVMWDVVKPNVNDAIDAYSQYELEFPEEDKYEVVLIGTSNVSTIYQTHSHYFGIEHHNSVLEKMEESIIGWAKRNDLDVGARRILLTLKNRQFWGKRTIAVSTLKNHFCQNIFGFDNSLEELRERNLITGGVSISLNIKKKKEINSFIS